MTELTRVQRREKNKKSNNIFPILKWVLIGFLVLFIIGISVFGFYASKAPAITQDSLQSAGSSNIYDENGKKLFNLGNEEREYASITHIPKQMQNAVVSIEDKRFYDEPFGIDPIRIISAGLGNLKSQSIQGGGSTLTQQLVKLSVFSTHKSDQTIKRKIQEIWLSMQVEKEYSKQQILEFYMNKVYLSNGIYGVKTAARYYYDKGLNELTLPQMALIAGMPQSPYNYDPYLHPQAAKTRRDLVLNAMYSNKKITKKDLVAAVNTPINDGLKAKDTNADATNSETRKISDPYLKEVISEAKKKGYDPYRDNLKITTNMDYTAQKKLYDIVNSSTYIYYPDDKIQIASTVVDPNTGKVVAMIGGRNQGDVQLGYNRAVQTSRSNGSTMKPIMDYAPALEYLGWSTAHPLKDSPYKYPGTNIELNNWDNSYMGSMTLRNALASSRNIPAVKTLQKVGFDKARGFAKSLGIDVPANTGLSAGIGYSSSTLQNAAAYSAFANGGYYRKPYFINKIETSDGVVHRYDSSAKKVMKSSTAYMITDILKDTFTNGMSSSAVISGLHHAGKTGETNYSDEALKNNPGLTGLAPDAWFDGYTKNYSISVWAGYDKQNKDGLNQSDQQLPQEVYKYLMSYLQTYKSNKDWKQPGNLTKVGRELYPSGSAPSIYSSNNSYSYVAPNRSTNDTTANQPTNDSKTTDNSGGDGSPKNNDNTSNNSDNNTNNSGNTDGNNSNNGNTNNNDAGGNTSPNNNASPNTNN